LRPADAIDPESSDRITCLSRSGRVSVPSIALAALVLTTDVGRLGRRAVEQRRPRVRAPSAPSDMVSIKRCAQAGDEALTLETAGTEPSAVTLIAIDAPMRCCMTDLRRLRLSVMLSNAERSVIDDFRLTHRLPSRAAAVRELLKLGLATSIPPSASGVKSSRYGVIHVGARDAPRDRQQRMLAEGPRYAVVPF
jgi:hypothetical protein